MIALSAAIALTACIATDGDTLRCGDQRIRLLGIDAPEMRGHCRKGRICAPGDPLTSKASLASAITLGSIRMEPVKRDRYGRTVAVVWAGRVNLSCWQIARGQAVYVAKWDHKGLIGRCGRGS